MDWAELNSDILRQISKKVTDLSDFVWLRAVCKKWRSVVRPSDLPPQLPYFIQCSRKSSSSFEFHLCPLYSDKSHNLTVQIFSELKELTSTFGSFTGFVILLCEVPPISGLILNPLIGFQSLVPIENEHERFSPFYIGPSLSHEPDLVENCIDLVGLVIEFEPPNSTRVEKLILWRYTDNKWRRITKLRNSLDEHVISYSNGRVFIASCKTKYIRVVDVTNGNTVSFLPRLSKPFHCFVEACGDLIGVRLLDEPKGQNLPQSGYLYELYQLMNSGTNPYWEKVNDIGDRMLFHDDLRNWLCLKASDFEGCKGNCIYSKSRITNNSVNYYSVATESTTQLHQLHNYNRGRWFLPSLC
ncbi:hypothetical protein LUZ63_009435 [Rhynchospora breviuscula]|uniref:F-box domain-containing protein n=1 Tax=Rhynchospora breviuscula TaxID=2022672 RepID=A0A9Q0CFG0_9POAL|nr:hypothetical protein LUZ63_009435 [Rhynchospora breviuscula]